VVTSGRVVLFAHYDAAGAVKPYVEHHLRALRSIASRLAFISTARLSSAELQKVRGLADDIIVRENVGFDFLSWAEALRAGIAEGAREVALVNSSVFGPTRPLADVFSEMERVRCDFWGLTEGVSPVRHLQSYFLVFRSAALASPAFTAFFDAVEPVRDKADAVRASELRLTAVLEEAGLASAALLPYERVHRSVYGRWPPLRPRGNQTYHLPIELLELGLPYVKIEALRGVLGRRSSRLREAAIAVRAALIRRALAAKGYPPELVVVEGRPAPPTLG
jgi:lipopolysaccharide biosynthesis protein